nr:Chain B, Metchnikowin [Drosophila melanogaster]
PRPGPIYY